jgi:eukaryotic-like serine/threonine-protein kinase
MSIEKIGKVTILATLGAGAHSSILKVRREEDGKEYALKLVPIEEEEDKKFLEQAKHEHRVGQMLNHPNLVKVYTFETESNWRFQVKKAKLLIEFVPGETLDKCKLLNPAKMMRVFEKTALGLMHMHKKGVIHADIKPNNIMLGRGTTTKVLDYGLAWIKGEPKDRIQGTPEYIAPETAIHKLINERTDIYNFGVTMYRLVTFKFPPNVIPAAEGLEHTEKSFHEALKPVRELNPGCHPELAESMAAVQQTLDALADEAVAKFGDPDEMP